MANIKESNFLKPIGDYLDEVERQIAVNPELNYHELVLAAAHEYYRCKKVHRDSKGDS